MPTVDREELLKQLLSVSPGLSPREIVEQSSCFVFLNGKVITFNDEVACWTKCTCLNKVAVRAKTLVDLLQKLPEETLHVAVSNGKLIVKGKKRVGRIPIEDKISLPFKSVEEPKKWKTLPSDFLEAVNLVYRCAGIDQQQMEKYVHVHPERIEACMEHQVGCFRTRIEIDEPLLIHRDSIKHVVSLGVVEFGITETWAHFRNSKGLVICCRRWKEDTEFPDTSAALSIKGTKVLLPKGLAAAAERASIFSRENAEDDDIIITLKSGELTVVGTGASGEYREGPKALDYKGQEMTFMISPKLLADITSKHNEAWFTPDTLKVKQGKFTFVTALGTMEDKKQAKDDEDEERAESSDEGAEG